MDKTEEQEESERILRVLCSLTMADQRNRERKKGKVRERFCD